MLTIISPPFVSWFITQALCRQGHVSAWACPFAECAGLPRHYVA